jgi:hypothetical protein
MSECNRRQWPREGCKRGEWRQQGTIKENMTIEHMYRGAHVHYT